jgi:hypothetical protein
MAQNYTVGTYPHALTVPVGNKHLQTPTSHMLNCIHDRITNQYLQVVATDYSQVPIVCTYLYTACGNSSPPPRGQQ